MIEGTFINHSERSAAAPGINDVQAVLQIAEKKIYLDTISWDHLEQFAGLLNLPDTMQVSSLRARFRKALNTCYLIGYCRKVWIGTNYYQTGDTLGGKSCLMWEFDAWIRNEKPDLGFVATSRRQRWRLR